MAFRDWLRAHPEEAARYERTKRALAAEHADDPDYDDYTRAKTAYFDQVQASIERTPLTGRRTAPGECRGPFAWRAVDQRCW